MVKLDYRLPLVGASMNGSVEALKTFLALKLGNVVLMPIPDDKQEALDVARFCREHHIFWMASEIVHRHSHKRWHGGNLTKADVEEVTAEAGEYFIGRYAVGESGGMLYWPKSYVINAAVGAYDAMPPCANEAEAHRKYVEYIQNELAFERREIGDTPLFNVDSSIAFSYHAEAGIDGQCVELLPGDPRLTLSAIRGTARAAHCAWGAHIAMLWYGGMELDRLWQCRWRIALWSCFMAGAEFIYPESGHLVYDAPGAKPLGFHTPELKQVRRELRELYRFSQLHDRPAAGPEVPVAILQGNCDGSPGIWNPYAWGQYNNGTKWELSDAERGWALYDTLFLKEDVFHAGVTGDHNRSGNPPCGQLDVIPPAADFSRYRQIILIGYNRMDDALYDKLIAFVRNGGHLLLWLSHFDTAEKRGDEIRLFNHADLSALCGFKVSGRIAADVRGMKIVQPSALPGYRFPFRSICVDPTWLGRSEAAEIDVTDPSLRVIAAYSDTFNDTLDAALKRPLLVERRLGKGAVLTVTTFSAPGAEGMRGFAEMVMRTAVNAFRTELELLCSDQVRYAVYPAGQGKRLYLLNCDPDCSQCCRVECCGKVSHEMMLAPGEFRTLYFEDGLLFNPNDHFCDLVSASEDSFRFATCAQRVAVENPGAAERQITLNGVGVTLAPGERKSVELPAWLPEAKAKWLAPDFLEEPELSPADTSTPY